MFYAQYFNDFIYWIILGVCAAILFNLLIGRENSNKTIYFFGVTGSIIGGLVIINTIDAVNSINLINSLIIVSVSLVAIFIYESIFINIFKPLDSQKDKSNKYIYTTYHQIGKSKYLSNNKELSDFIKSVTYPVSKRDLISVAEKEMKNEESITVLENVPDHIYTNQNELRKTINKYF